MEDPSVAPSRRARPWQAGSRSSHLGDSPDRLGGEVIEAEIGMGVQEGGDQLLVLSRGDGARRVDKHAARTERSRAGGEDPGLRARHLADRLGRHAPAQVGACLQRAQPGAGRVDEHAIEAPVPRPRPRGVGELDAHVCRARAAERSRARAPARRALRSTPRTSPRPCMSAARCVLLPPGAAHRSSTRSPGRGASARATSIAPRDCARNAPARHDGEPCTSNGSSSTSASGMPGSPWLRTGSSSSERRSVGHERVRPQRHLRRLVVGGHQRAGLLSAELSPPQARDPLRVRVLHGGLLGRRVGERSQQGSRALARGPAQHRVDETVARAAPGLGQLDGVRDDGAVGRAAQVEQLVQPEPQRRQHRRVEPRGGPLGQCFDQVIERALALNRAVGQAHRERPVAPVQLPGLRLEGLLGVGAVLEHPPQHRVGTAASGGDRGADGLVTSDLLGRRPGSPWPRRYAEASIARPPGGCTTTSSSTPGVQSSSRRPSRSPLPGPPSPRPRPRGAGPDARPSRPRSASTAMHPEQRAVGERHARPDVRVQRAHDPLQLDRGPGGIEQAIGRPDLLRVGDTILALLDVRRGLQQGVARSAPHRAPAAGRRANHTCRGGRIGSCRARHTGPLSSPAVRRMIDTPVCVSPAMIARSIGAAPRQRGSSDGWTFRSSCSDSSGSLMSAPNAQTTTAWAPAARPPARSATAPQDR